MGCIKWYKFHDYGNWSIVYEDFFGIQQKRICKCCGYTDIKQTLL